ASRPSGLPRGPPPAPRRRTRRPSAGASHAASSGTRSRRLASSGAPAAGLDELRNRTKTEGQRGNNLPCPSPRSHTPVRQRVFQTLIHERELVGTEQHLRVLLPGRQRPALAAPLFFLRAARRAGGCEELDPPAGLVVGGLAAEQERERTADPRRIGLVGVGR